MNPNNGYNGPPMASSGPPKGPPPPSSGIYANSSQPPASGSTLGNNAGQPSFAPPAYGNPSVYNPPASSVPMYSNPAASVASGSLQNNTPPVGPPPPQGAFSFSSPSNRTTSQQQQHQGLSPNGQHVLPPTVPRPLPPPPSASLPSSNNNSNNNGNNNGNGNGNPTSAMGRAPSYTNHAPAPILASSGNSIGSGLDSKGSSGSEKGRYTTYNTGAFTNNNNNNRVFNTISPGQSSSNLTSLQHPPPSSTSYQHQHHNQLHSTSNSNLSQYNSVPYGDITNTSVISPTSGLRRNDATKVDPAQMPHPDKPLLDVVYHTRSGSGRRNPPGGNSIYTAIDTGNCTPRHMRATLVAPPLTKALLDKTGLPLAIIATPFAPTENGEAPVPQVDLGPLPPRCSRCNAYINPSVIWGENGNSWTCNLCSMVNETPPWYYCSLDGAGQRLDRSSRPELQLGSVDFLVNEDYCVRSIQEPIYVFAIDISHKACANGATIAAIRSVRVALNKLRLLEAQYAISALGASVNDALREAAYSSHTPPPSQRHNPHNHNNNNSNNHNNYKSSNSSNNSTKQACIRAAIVTFDKNIQFYSVNMSSAEPVKMFEVSGEDPLCPVPYNSLLYSVSQCDTALEHLLQRIPELVAAKQSAEEEVAYSSSSNINSSAAPKTLSRNLSGTGFGGSSPRGTTPRTPGSRPNSGVYENNNNNSTSEVGGESPNCIAAVIKALQEALNIPGGRVIVMSTSHATTGFLKLSRGRERVNLYGTRDEINLYGYSSAIVQGVSMGVKDTALTTLSSATTFLSATAGSASSVHASKVSAQNAELIDDMKKISTAYRELATDCARSNVCVSVVACVGDDCLDGGTFFDTALLGEVTTLTGGQLHLFTGSLLHEDNLLRLEQQIVGDISMIAANEAVVKCRTSVGLRVEKILGPGVFNPLRSEVECSGLDTHTTYHFGLTYDSALKEDERVHYQVAILHTTPNRQRVIRVHNLTTIASPKPTIVFRNCDIEAVVVALLKEGIDKALTYPLSEECQGVRGFLDSAVANALYKYRLHCSPGSPRGQLVLPDSLKVMPIYTLSMLKHPAIMENRSALGTNNTAATAGSSVTQTLLTNNTNDGTRLAFIPTYGNALSKVAVRAHERSYELRRLLSSSLVECVNSIYPRLYNISTLFDDCERDDLILSSSYDEQRMNSSSEDQNFSNDSIEVSDEYLANISTNSVSFNNLLGRNAVGLQLSHPNTTPSATNNHNNNNNSSILGLSSPSQDLTAAPNPNTLLLRQLAKKVICNLSPTAEVFENDQIYLLDDRTTLYLYVGRSVPAALIDEMMETQPAAGGLGRKDCVTLRMGSELGRRLKYFIDILRFNNAHKQELKVVWAELANNNPLHAKFSARLVEDSNLGLMSYVDYLCNMHIKIQAKIK